MTSNGVSVSGVLFIALSVSLSGIVGCSTPGLSGISSEREVELLSHDLAVQLVPGHHRLVATDRQMLKVLNPELKQISFLLHPMLHVTRVEEQREGIARALAFKILKPQDKEEGDESQQIAVRLGRSLVRGEVLTLDWSYEGTINDPPRQSHRLRFVRPSETNGHIGSEGVYLSGETHWYPDRPRSRATFRVQVTTPEGWHGVTHGREVSRVAEDGHARAHWDVLAKTEALTLVANRFVTKQRTWNGIEVATYLFPEDAHLADEYLGAAIRYLGVYTKLLGPYPFPKFALVENFFPSGLGMPSFTLLGSRVVKRRYVQPYALGHEIVHSWIGNSVLNDVEDGNWVEGLTTYLANYYYDELTGRAEEAREQRRMMLVGYAVYVRPEEDYPVGRFRSKENQRDNAIGYQKSAMIFHMLRREIGEQAFWAGIRKLVAEYTGAYANWKVLEELFGEASGQDLRWFFAQWVERAGAPRLQITDALYRADVTSARSGGHGGYVVSFRVKQHGTPYRLHLHARVKMSGGRVHTTRVEVESAEETFNVAVPALPVALEIDPNYESFRRISREDLPPMLNLFVTDSERAVVLPGVAADTDAPYRGVAERLMLEQQGQGSRQRSVTAQVADTDVRAARGSVLVLGGPGQNRAADWAVGGCGNRVKLGANAFTVEGRLHKGSGMALLVTCRHPDRPESVVSLFYGLTPPAAAKVARLLFFYGWQSYLIFRDGSVVARGDFAPPKRELEVLFDG